MLTKKYVFGVAVVVVVIICVWVMGINGLLPHGNSHTTPQETGKEAPYYLQVIDAKPDDFDSVLSELCKWGDICELGEEYYLQPELYGGSWRVGKWHYEAHDYSRWVVHGYGAYPAYPKVAFASNKIGEEVQTCTFYRTGWGVETWQGIKLMPEENNYFDVVVEPDEFLLFPTFPIFERGWVKRLNITVKIKQSPPDGTYNIVVDVINPSEEKSRMWADDVLKQNISILGYEKMLKECQEQSEKENLTLDCEELINLRRNKYMEGGYIEVGGRLIITIVVEAGDEK